MGGGGGEGVAYLVTRTDKKEMKVLLGRLFSVASSFVMFYIMYLLY
jgi:hypothetical protein